MPQPQPLDEAELSFPSRFFNGADFLMDNLNYPRNGTVKFDFGGNLSFPNEFPYDFNSFRSSPVDSVVGSTETESSDEDDFLVGLTRRLAQSSLIETQKLVASCFSKDKPEIVWTGSPQSTLSGIGSWSGKSTMPSKGSPTGPFSQVPSPPASPLDDKNENWDLIYAAAGHVASMTMGSKAFYGKQENRGLTGPTRQNITVSSLSSNPNTGYYLDELVSHNQSQIQHLRVNQSFKPQFQCPTSMGKQANNVGWSVQSNQQQIQNRGRTCVCESGGCGHPLNLTQTVSPSLHVHNQKHQTQYQYSASRPGLHGGSVVKKECAGTGVFLPRRYNHPPESRKKSGVPKVDMAKTVQSQNLTFQDSKGHVQSRFVNGLLSNHEAMMSRRNALFALQRNLRQEVAVNHEIRLPQEWTY